MYGDFVMMVDAMVGRVLAALDQCEMTQDTMVVFTSDNGPVWYEEDVERFDHDSSGGLRGMKADAWEGGHRMPFIVRWPEKVRSGSVTTQTVCFTDLLATFADIVDQELPPAAGPDSFSFLPVLTGKQPDTKSIRDSLVIHSGGGFITVREGDWKLIMGLGSGGFSQPRKVKPRPDDPAGQLYNLTADLGETNNLYAQHPEIVQRLTTRYQKIRDAGRHR